MFPFRKHWNCWGWYWVVHIFVHYGIWYCLQHVLISLIFLAQYNISKRFVWRMSYSTSVCAKRIEHSSRSRILSVFFEEWKKSPCFDYCVRVPLIWMIYTGLEKIDEFRSILLNCICQSWGKIPSCSSHSWDFLFDIFLESIISFRWKIRKGCKNIRS